MFLNLSPRVVQWRCKCVVQHAWEVRVRSLSIVSCEFAEGLVCWVFVDEVRRFSNQPSFIILCCILMNWLPGNEMPRQGCPCFWAIQLLCQVCCGKESSPFPQSSWAGWPWKEHCIWDIWWLFHHTDFDDCCCVVFGMLEKTECSMAVCWPRCVVMMCLCVCVFLGETVLWFTAKIELLF